MRHLLYFALIFFSGSLSAQQSFLIQKKASGPFRENLGTKGSVVAFSGDFAFSGAPRASNDTNGVGAGSPMYNEFGNLTIYRKDSAGVWQYFQALQGVPRMYMAYFGSSLAVSDSTLVVGAPGQRIGPTRNGAVQIFKLRGGRWQFDTLFTSPDTSHAAGFGGSIAIEGTTLVVGAAGNATDSVYGDTLSNAGAAYVFEYQNGSWLLQEKLSAGQRQVNAYFGSSLAIKNNRIVVSSPQESGTYGPNAIAYTGADYVFDRNAAGHWNQSMHITDSAFDGGAWGYRFVGSNLLRSSPRYFHGFIPGSPWPASDAGSLFYLQLNANSYSIKQRINVSQPAWLHYFASSFDFDGQRLAVSCPRDDYSPLDTIKVTDAGSVWIYSYDSINDQFNFEETVVASDRAKPKSEYDNFGQVAISGEYLLVGVPGDDEDSTNQNPINDAGSLYFYQLGCRPLELVQNDSICAGDSLWFRGNYYHTTGIYTDTVSFSTLCDSTYTLDLFVRPATIEDTVQVQSCDVYTTLGGQQVTQSGFYTDTLSNQFGCDSLVVQDLTVIAVDTSVVRSGRTLKAQAQNASFQWINCATDSVIIGATADSLIAPSGSGVDQFFAVIVNQNGCSDTSFCFRFESDLGLSESLINQVTVYPNPGSELNFKTPAGLRVSELEIQDLQGRSIGLYQNPQQLKPQLPAGIYVLIGTLSDGQGFRQIWISED